ncbi:hypothetical protein N7532_002307 [Penicillium argentinense]|uniref:Uncharacterized protein n=1 Tax=Penicillium argentinense TaxID=1131581 RepID=A0A9W9G091_9EURO|nr:uncharacterized protein N7532_002307 [Penicillium argentinense]KAJ5109662.1 hypothetical protein N7532_002307 [Penicillium argentinense]
MPHLPELTSICRDGDASSKEPIAIVGVGLRLPGGVYSSEEFWDMLIDKRDGHGPVPSTRYNVEAFFDPSKAPVTGYYLQEDPACFDATFFSIPTQEAVHMDPQQRLLLEVVWECLENAGAQNWRGSRIGCYVGVFGEDWLEVALKTGEPVDRSHPICTGGFGLSNRVSYEFELCGPSMTIQTGCSASLVSLHEACRSLQAGDCSGAIVAGTNLIWTPTMTTVMNTNMVLSPSGICRTFDTEADGYGRGEAINAIYIKRLSDALRDNDPIRAVIRATSTNNDGRTETITHPCPTSQERLIRKAYRDAGIKDIHETAFLSSMEQERGQEIPVIKAVMALEHRIIPPNIHFDTPNPKIPFEEAKLEVPVEAIPWPKGRSERVSINSFGIGGSNAHVVLDSCASVGLDPPSATSSGDSQLLLITAHSPDALKKRVRDLTQYANNQPSSLHDLAYTLGVRRDHLSHRTFTVAHPHTPLDASTFKSSTPSSTAPRVNFVFTGQGAQWAGMGRTLLRSGLSFTQSIEEMDQALQELEQPPNWNLKGRISLSLPESSRINEAELAQPLCTALQVGLVNILREWGIEPHAVVGHSSGEIAAAYAAGAITAQCAIIIAYYRGRLAKSQEGTGAMAAVAMSREDAVPFLKDGVVLACENSPRSVTLSGDKDVLDEVLESIKDQNPDTFTRRLRVSIAYHSYHMSALGPLYEEAISQYIKPSSYMIPFSSSVTGETIVNPRQLNAAYWRQNLESPVLFSGAVESLCNTGKQSQVFLEIGPHSALAGPLGQIFQSTSTKKAPFYIPTLVRDDHDARSQLLSTVGHAFSAGISVNISAVVGSGVVLKDLPRYPWQHDSRHLKEVRVLRDWRSRPLSHHELLGSRIVESTDLEPSWRNMLHLDNVTWLSEHTLRDEVTFPGAGYITMAGEAVQQLHPEMTGYSLRNVHFKAPLILVDDHSTELITNLKPIELADGVGSDWYGFTIMAYDGTLWTTHCQGQVRAGADYLDEAKPIHPFPRSLDSKRWYQTVKRHGLAYGPRFQGLQDITADPSSTTAVATVTDTRELHASRYLQHPSAIDQCLQLMGIAVSSGVPSRLTRMYIPAMIESIYVGRGAQNMTVRVQTRPGMRGGQLGDAIGVINDQTAFSMKGGFLFGAEMPENSGVAAVRLASRMDLKPDIDLVPACTLLPQPPADDELDDHLKAGGLICFHYILAMATRLKDVHSDQPHLMKWKAWILAESAKINSGNHELFKSLFDWSEATETKTLLVLKLQKFHRALESDVKNNQAQQAFSSVLPQWICIDPIRRIEIFYEGKKSPLEALMQNDRWEVYHSAQDERISWSNFLSLLCHSNPTLRVLEIGAGSGSGTKKALPCLKSSGGVRMYSQYFFTDISPGFMAKAKEVFKHEEKIEYRTLDISRDPVAQGFEPHSFDLIIASNVLHATSNLKKTLEQVRKLLRSNGRLLFHEINPDLPTTSYIMGTLPGWWLGEEDDRPNQPFVTPERWDKELRAAGFGGIDAVVYDAEPPCRSVASMIARPAVEITFTKQISLLADDRTAKWPIEVEKHFQSRGYTVNWITLDQAGERHERVVSLLDIPVPFLGDTTEDSFTSLRRFFVENKDSLIMWVTKGSRVVCDEPHSGMIQGLARALRLELPLDICTLEVDTWDSRAVASLFDVYEKVQSARQASPPHTEYEFILHDGVVHTIRDHWTPISEQLAITLPPDTPRSLDIVSFGRLETLQWAPKNLKSQLDSEEVEVDIQFVGLNFMDLMIAMGLVGNPGQFGIEAAATVRRVGTNVAEFKPGDKVCLAGFGFLATRTILHQSSCLKYPDYMAAEDVVTFWSVYTTVLYSFLYVGNLQKGQYGRKSVLIHSGTGGIGLAAINLCQAIGAEGKDTSLTGQLLCTCSYESNQWTGVDIVLNSLAGKLLHASWECVAPFGKMIEIGKRDFMTHGALEMGPFLANRTFVGVDMLHLLTHNLELRDRVQDTLFEYLRKGVIQPIRPIQVFDADRIEDAMRYMQAGTHMGKIVIQMPSNPASLPCPAIKQAPHLPSDASYLLVGGLGGIGRAISTWLVEHGARELVYLSRSAGQSDDDEKFIRELEAQSCKVICVTGTVTSMIDVERAVSQCTKRLAGVVQMAIHLKDVSFQNMSYNDWSAALLPKVTGTWNLHNATEGTALDFFILFSSLVGISGSLTQANYVAANAFMNSFVQYRRQRGLAASVLNLGAVVDIGVISRRPDYLQNANLGRVPLLYEKEVLQGFQVAIKDSPCNTKSGNLVVGMGHRGPISDTMTRPLWGHDARFSLYANLQSAVAVQRQAKHDHLRALLAQVDLAPDKLDDAEYTNDMRSVVRRTVADYVLPGKELDDEQMAAITVDSLTAIELKNWTRRIMKVEISLKDINQAGTLEGLSILLLNQLKSKYNKVGETNSG